MNQKDFLEKHIFTELTNQNDGFDSSEQFHFSEADFETVLQRAEHFGLGIYEISPWRNGALYATSHHVEMKKKATDPRWYKKAFLTFKTAQPGMSYTASYKVSNKLLAR